MLTSSARSSSKWMSELIQYSLERSLRRVRQAGNHCFITRDVTWASEVMPTAGRARRCVATAHQGRGRRMRTGTSEMALNHTSSSETLAALLGERAVNLRQIILRAHRGMNHR